MSTTITQPRHPLRLYVVFHPKAKESPHLAESIFRWFHRQADAELGTGTGIPVVFRTACDRGELIPAIDRAQARHSVVIALVDDAMAVDEAWWPTLEALAKPTEDRRVHFLPVMVDRSFVRLPIRGQPLRIFKRSDPSPPRADPEGEAAKQAREERLHLRSRRLRRALTEALIRCVRCDTPGEVAPRLKVFISHAKDDGIEIATRLRDGLASISQLEPWFDQNDLSPGIDPAGPMTDAAGRSTGGMIAVISDLYPTRPWCRHEARQARTPSPRAGLERREPQDFWTVQPTVAVMTSGQTWTRTPAPLAQVHRLGWPAADRARQDDFIADVVDRLLLEILVSDVVALQNAHLTAPQRTVLAFVPDAWTLSQILPAGDPEQPRELFYPGHRLRTAEHEELAAIVEASFKETKIRPIEELELDGLDAPGDASAKRLLVALSVGGRDSELWRSGHGVCHLDDLVVKITRQLLVREYHIAYGGALSQEFPTNLTRALFDAAEGWRSAEEFDLDKNVARALDAERLTNPPVRNYAAGSSTKHITDELRAQHLGLVRFICFPADNGQDSDAITKMRVQLANDCDVRVLAGGKIHGWSGWLPGIAEEFVTSYRAKKAVILLARFGGCAALLAEYLTGDGQLPADLTHEVEAQHRHACPEWHADDVCDQRRRLFTEMATTLAEARQEYHSGRPDPRIFIVDEADGTAAIAAILRHLNALRSR